ncbi:MAG TPA: thiol peroxidase [Herpetosiphonaceae bacterium]
MVERTNEAFEFDEKLTVVGAKLEPGAKAPEFELDLFDAAAGAMRSVRLSDSAGAPRLLNVVNSVDTPVCHVETRKWEEARPGLPAEVTVYTISMDLPFALARWKTSEGIGHELLSSHKSEQFGEDYGVLLKEWRMLQRAVFVIDGEGVVRHAEYVPDQMQEPDYEAALASLR